MTRDFNKQRRDDMRPSSREQSPDRNGDERSPRPARPRLNRESVDRAWESGAPSHHADYRTRSNNGNRGPAPRNNWRDDQHNGQSAQNRQGGQYPARNSRPSFGNQPGDRPAGPRRFDNTTGGNQSNQTSQRPPSRPFSADRPDRPNRPYGNNRPGSPSQGNGTRPEYRDHSRPYEPRPSYRSNEQGGGFQRRDRDYHERTDRRDGYEHNERGPRQFERNNYSDASTYNGHPTRSFDRDRRAPGNNHRDARTPRDAEIRDTQNPRWQSRPAAQRDSGNRREQNDFQAQPGRERYQGDYEHFNGAEEKPRFAGRPSQRYEKSKPRRLEAKKPQPEVEERHVTPLPDGRVLKGPRPVQRKNAEFWTGIAQNTDALLDGVKEVLTPQEQAQVADGSAVEHVLPTNDNPAGQTLPTNDSVEAQEMPTNENLDVQTLPTDGSTETQEHTVAEEDTLPVKAKSRTRATSVATRSKKASEKQKDTQTKTSGPKPRPSKRGFKWPTPE
ncbi:MAG: hypothetical protein ABI406_03615 [Ktedonobacteraceae bacterium]